MREIITLATAARETLVDITSQVKAVVDHSGMTDGIVTVYAQGATACLLYTSDAADE